MAEHHRVESPSGAGYESYFRPQVEIALGKLRTRLEASRGTPTLNLADAFIGDEGCELVGEYIKENEQLTSLELRGNNITAEGAKAIGAALAVTSSLRTLSLEWNSIGNGTAVFAEQLSRNSSITNLDLRNNRIGPEGVAHLAKMLEVNRTISRLDLRWNEIGSAGAQTLLTSLQRNKTLATLEISGNKISEDVLGQIQSTIAGEEITASPVPRTISPRAASMSRAPAPRSPLAGVGASAGTEPVIPINILNKEKAFAEEIHQKIESQLLANTRSESRITELETLFEQERRKAKEVREELTQDLDNEMRQKQHKEDAIYTLQEEMNRRQLDDARIIQELEGKLHAITSEHDNTRIEYERVHDQLEKLESGSTERVADLEDRIAKQAQFYRELDDASSLNYQRLKADHENEIRSLTSDFEARLAAIEVEIKNAKDGKERWDFDYKNLHSQMVQEREANEAEFNRVETKVREEETANANSLIKTLENRMRLLEQSREEMTLKNQELQREMIRQDKYSMEQLLNLEAYSSTLYNEKIDLENQIQNAKTSHEELNSEIAYILQNIDRTRAEKDQVLRSIQQRKEAHKSQMDAAYQEHAAQRKNFGQVKSVEDEKIFAMKGQLTEMRKKVSQIKEEHDRLKESILSAVEEAVQQTVYKHVDEL